MPVQNLITLSLDGVIRDPMQKADRLLSYFFVNDMHQSNNQYGLIASLPGILKESGNKPEIAASSIQNALYELFYNYYDSVNCDVVAKSPDNVLQTGNDMSCDLEVNMSFKQNGKTYQLAKIATVVNSKLVKVAEVKHG